MDHKYDILKHPLVRLTIDGLFEENVKNFDKRKLFAVDAVSRRCYNVIADTMSTCERRNNLFKGTLCDTFLGKGDEMV